MMLRKIRIGDVIIGLALLICASTNSFWGYRFFHDSKLSAGIACLIPLVLLLFALLKEQDRINALQFATAVSVYAVILASSRCNPKQVLFYGFCVALLLYPSAYDHRHMLKWFLILGVLFSLGSVIYLCFPGFYRSAILPAFTGSSQYGRLVRWTRRTSYLIVPGFTNQTSFTACFFIYGIGYILCRYSRGRRFTAWEYGLLFLFTVCLVLTNKRAHFLFTMLALMSVFYLSASKEQRGYRLIRMAALLIAAAVVLYILVSTVDIGVFKKIRTMFVHLSNDEDIASGRGELGVLAIKYFLKKPLFGIGWDGFMTIPELEVPIQVHNIYLELLCETGIIGFSVMVFFFFWSFRAAVRSCRYYANGPEAAAARFCLFIQTFFLLYGLTGNPLYDPPYFIPYFLVCAFSFAFSRKIYDAPRILFRPKLTGEAPRVGSMI